MFMAAFICCCCRKASQVIITKFQTCVPHARRRVVHTVRAPRLVRSTFVCLFTTDRVQHNEPHHHSEKTNRLTSSVLPGAAAQGTTTAAVGLTMEGTEEETPTHENSPTRITTAYKQLATDSTASLSAVRFSASLHTYEAYIQTWNDFFCD